MKKGIRPRLAALLMGCFTAGVGATDEIPTPAAPAVATVDADAVREEFMAAMQRIRQHLLEEPDSPALTAYVIHDYLIAARLRRDVAQNANNDLDTQVDDFLKSHTSQPVARPLRREWLASLASRKRWDWFLPRSTDAAEPLLACDRLAGRLATGDTAGLAQDVLARWSIAQKQPDECNPVFVWLRDQNAITPALAESRTRAALSADNPRVAREFLIEFPPQNAAALLQWIQLLDAPKAALGLLSINTAQAVEPDALVAGFTRLAGSDHSAAATLLPLLLKRPDMTPTVETRLRRALALSESYSRVSGAVAAFTDLTLDATDTQAEEWRVRAALWAGDYAAALRWIDDMPPSLGTLPRWRYWRARAVSATSGPAAAAPIYAEIAGLRDYYGYLAADRIAQGYNLNIHPSPNDLDAQSALAADPGMMRAHALFVCDLADDAGVEWAAVLSGAKPSLKVQAAHLASQWGWYAQTIATLAQAGEWDDVPLRYPRPYAANVAEAAKLTSLQADWIYAVMRQESLFRKDAVSRADARGLMQMLPATATTVAHRWRMTPPTRQTLFDPDVAVPLGAMYLRELLDKYNGQLDQTLAAYNAGPQPVARWLPPNPMDADVWIENIPYSETRGYITHIVEHIVAFAAMRDAVPPRLSALLPKLDPQVPSSP